MHLDKKRHLFIVSLGVIAFFFVFFSVRGTIVRFAEYGDNAAQVINSTPKTYYACDCGQRADGNCQPGNDANTGLSPQTAFKSYAKARQTFVAMNPGDNVLLCKGGSFSMNDTSNALVNYKCTATLPCTLSDYIPLWASGDEGKPQLWKNDKVEPAVYIKTLVKGIIVRNLEFIGDGRSTGIFAYGLNEDVVLENLLVRDFTIGVYPTKENVRFALRNSRIINNSQHGLYGGCVDCVIENNYFENNGFAQAILNHNVYLSGGLRISLRNNELYKSAIVDGSCQGVSLVVHGVVTDLTIENNFIHEDIGKAKPTCWGIGVDSGYVASEADEKFERTIIRGNKIVNVGDIAIGISSCPECVIENNQIVQEQTAGGTAIAVPDRGRGANDALQTDVTVKNNSIYFGPNSLGTGITLKTEGVSHSVIDNAIYFAGTRASTCFVVDLPYASYESFDRNICYSPNATNFWVNDRGINRILTEWRTISGFDLVSDILNPQFANIQSPYNLTRSRVLSSGQTTTTTTTTTTTNVGTTGAITTTAGTVETPSTPPATNPSPVVNPAPLVNPTPIVGPQPVQIPIPLSSPRTVNQAPSVNVGPDLTINASRTVIISAAVNDDGLPQGQREIKWIKVSGPGEVVFDNDTSSSITARFTTNGSYVLRLMVSDTMLTTFDDVVVSVGANIGTAVSVTPSRPLDVPPLPFSCQFNRNLRMGDRGLDVRYLQQILNSTIDTQISATRDGSPGFETTYFGALTRQAVIKFQNKYRNEILVPAELTFGNGFVGALTRAVLSKWCR